MKGLLQARASRNTAAVRAWVLSIEGNIAGHFNKGWSADQHGTKRVLKVRTKFYLNFLYKVLLSNIIPIITTTHETLPF